jgi:hypothetical protein
MFNRSARSITKFAAMAAVLLISGNLSAAVLPCPSNTDLGTLIASFNSLANACQSQDKLFWNFSYTNLGTQAPTAANVQAGVIFQPGVGVDIHGWNFSAVWSQAGNSTNLANFTLSYTIEIVPGTPNTQITSADAVYAPSSQAPPGPETVTWSAGTPSTQVLTSASPGPLPPTGLGGLPANFQGPITVTANFSGTGAITQTTLRFYETTLSAVPEPATMLLCGLGFLGLGIIRHRRKA